MLKKIFKKKIIIPLLIILIMGGYFGYKAIKGDGGETRYALASVEKGTIIVSVSGSGQVSSLDEADIKAEVGGKLFGLYISKGDEVKKGELIAGLDDEDLRKAVTNAQISLEVAQADLEDLINPTDRELSLLQAENALTKAQQAKIESEDGIEEGLEDAFNSIATIFFDLPTIVTATSDVLYSNDIGESESTVGAYQENLTAYQSLFVGSERSKIEPYVQNAISDYQTAKEKYDKNLTDYKNISRYSDEAAIESLLNETIETAKALSEAIKSEINLLDFITDYLSISNRRVYSKITEYQTSLKSYYSKTNGFMQTLYSVKNSLKDNKQALSDAEILIKEKESALNKLKAGPTELEVRTKQLVVQQKEDALSDAKEDLANASIYALLSGVISEVKVENGDSVSSGTVIAHIITKQKIAEITLNEVDVASIKAGQSATITFDALSDITVTGKVIDVDEVGEASQGVVSYGVKISLDTDNEQIKPGMSLTANIITQAKQNVLILPSSAVKSQEDESYYVQLVNITDEQKLQQLLANTSGVVLSETPTVQSVEIGISDDTNTEIISGLKEGDTIIYKTISSNSSSNKSSSSSSSQSGNINTMRALEMTTGGGMPPQ